MEEPRTKSIKVRYDGITTKTTVFFIDKDRYKLLKIKEYGHYINEIVNEVNTMKKYGVSIEYNFYNDEYITEYDISFNPTLDTDRLNRLIERALRYYEN